MDDDRMSVSSGSSEPYSPEEPTIVQESTPASLKRVSEDGDAPVTEKRQRLEGTFNGAETSVTSKAEELPPEIWQHILSYLTPPTLGLSMMVSKSFTSYLDGSIPPRHKCAEGRLQTMDAEALWASWRVAHPDEAANMPRPLEGHRERDMWRLIRGIRCDLCKKLDEQPRKPTSPDLWRGGPTMSTTRAIWPFGLRLCGECLYRNCEKDTTLLLTSAKQFRPALPYVFLTHDFNYVPTTLLKEAGQAPAGLHISKQFYKGYIEDISQQWEHTLTLGQAAAEEWLKGLDGMGNKTMVDAGRWEHWENKGGFNRVLFAFVRLQPAPIVQPTPTQGWAPNNMLSWPSHSVPPQQPQFGQMPSGPPHIISQHPSAPAMHTPFAQPAPQFSPHAHGQSPFAHAPPPGTPTTNQLQRMERNPRDANEAKAARRQQIEQRSLTDIHPPMPPNVLRHMPAFQAAIQIGIPLNDAAWEALKPKLLEQRPAAEQTEREATAALLAIQHQVENKGRRQAHSKDKADAEDKEWKEALRPIRDRLSDISSQFIREQWKNGEIVNSGNVARFAMAVFDHVRKVFYDEVAAADRLAIATGQPIPPDPPEGPFRRKLTLELMKWVYDNKIRPVTRHFGNHLFLCMAADCQMKTKMFAFEGVIQHIGAIHTHTFSKGNVVVHWPTAEWPEELPFFDPGSGPMPSSNHGNGGYSRGTTTSPQGISGPTSNGSSSATGPFGAPQHGHSWNAQYPPPNGNGYPPYIPDEQQYGQRSGVRPTAPGHSSAFDPTDLSQYFKSGGIGMPDPAPATQKLTTEQLNAVLAALGAQPGLDTAAGHHAAPHTEDSVTLADTEVPDFEVYQEQMKFVADTARSAWNSTNAIHGLSTSVRVFAVIQSTVLKFSHRFDSQLPVATFAAALMNHATMEPLKQAEGLLCRQCQAWPAEAQVPTRLNSPTNLISLISHFQNVHPSMGGNVQDRSRGASWVGDMIAISSPETIPDLINAPGLTDEKLAVLAEAFPELLPQRLPRPKDAPRDHFDHRSGRKPKRGNGRKASNGRRMDLEDANLADSEGSGKNGFRSSASPGEIREDEQYDPARPGLSHQGGHHKKQRDFSGRKTSGMGSDLAQLVAAATEQSNKAAAEENRRRGIISDIQPELGHAQRYSETSHHEARPGSAPRPPLVYVNRQDPGDRHMSCTCNRSVTKPPNCTDASADNSFPGLDPRHDHPDQGGYRHGHLVHNDLAEHRPIGTPPSASRTTHYARYDEQHERALQPRTRSRSPIRYDDPTSPERAYQTRQRDYMAPDRQRPIYQYLDGPEPILVDQYGQRLRLVRVDDSAPPPPPPGYAIPRRSPGEVDYADRQPPHNPQYYEVPPDARYDPRYHPQSAPYASQSMLGTDNRYD